MFVMKTTILLHSFSLSLKIFFLCIPMLSTLSLFSQKRTDTSYTSIPYYDIEGQDAPKGYERPRFTYFNSSFSYATFEFSKILKANFNNKKEQQRLENAKQQALSKLGMIKTQYAEYTTYPAKIIDGWHSAIATDNLNFCKDVKVEVKNNKIIKFVLDNYIPMNFMATREIKNAKNVVSIKNFNDEQLNLVELFFLYDIDEPRLVPEPIKPGYVCFWTDINKNYEQIEIKVDNIFLENFTVSYDSKPDCFSNGMVCRILKPGTYSMTANGRGGKRWKGTFEIKENMCLEYRLGKYTFNY